MRDLYDAPLQTLFEPFAQQRLPLSGPALFLNARLGGPLHACDRAVFTCQQSFKPAADALLSAGYSLAKTTDELADREWSLILLLPPRQREAARALMAWALFHVSAGGRVVIAASNNEGARSSEEDLRKLAGGLEVMSKNKCRVCWTAPLRGPADAALAAEWAAADQPRAIAGTRFISRPGIFAWDRVDAASALLATCLPNEAHGRAADLGAGFGFLSSELLGRCAGITHLDVYEAEYRALEMARANLAPTVSSASIRYLWHDVLAGLDSSYDVIVTNPPFHAQRQAERTDLGRRFLEVAAAALNAGGCLWMVANRHLPYEEVLHRSFAQVRTVTQQHGFKVIAARKSSTPRRDASTRP